MNWNPNQPPPPQQPGFAPQGFGQPAYQQPGQAPRFAPQGQAPQFAPQGQAPQGYAPQGQLPANQGRMQQNQPMVDLDNANAEESSEHPKCHPAGGQPWFFNLEGASEKASFHEVGTIVWVTAKIRHSPDPQYTPGMLVSIKIGGLGHPTKNNAAQGRLKALLGACCSESTTAAYPPGHWAARRGQLLGGQLTGAPFMATFGLKGSRRDQSGNLMQALVPSFQAG